PGGMGDPEYLAAFRRVLLPIAWRFEPELVLVSCGFDASAGDPLGSMRVTPNGFARLTAELQPLAGGRLLLALEGGYNLEAISRSAAACLRVLLDEPPAPVDTRPPNLVAERVLQAVIRAQEPFWPHLSEAKE